MRITLTCIMVVCVFNLYSSLCSRENTKVEVVELILQLDTGVVCAKHLENSASVVANIGLRKVFDEFDVKIIRAALYNRYKHGRLIDWHDEKITSMWQIIETKSSEKDEIIEKLTTLKCVKSVCINNPVKIIPALYEKNLYIDDYWHLYGTHGIDINGAWGINKGRSDVIVAVCDGGIDYTHPDLDDGRRTRIIHGYDFGDNDDDPMDDLPQSADSYYSHGTHIAGIIGAITNNGIGVNGIMQNCKIMPVKMVSSEAIKSPFGGTIVDFSAIAKPVDVANAVDFAVNNGAHVINLSYGFSGMGFPINEIVFRIPLLSSVLANAYKNNVVIVAAIGNEYQEGNPINYPAAFYRYLIPVGATNKSGQRASFSSTGNHISVSAPGVNILSTVPKEQYEKQSGTSMAAPVVAGIAGLIISQSKDRGLNLSNDDVKHILECTADDIPPVGWDVETGHGKVNAFKALRLIDYPNSIVHGFAVGSNAGKTSVGKWIYTGDGKLPAGMYLGVERYKMTKRVVFDVPFVNPPVVWMRERDSRCFHAGNPNSGEPYAEISNITTTGFDITYYTYYVPYNSSGTSVNTWIPASLSESGIAYTAIGIKTPLHRLTLSGPTQVCTEATFTLNNLPAGATVQWSSGGGRWNALELASGQGTAQATYRTANNGQGIVSATVSLNGASTTLSQKAWAGIPIAELEVNSDGIGRASACLKHAPLNMHAGPPVWQLWNPSQQVNFVVDDNGRCGMVRNASGHWSISGNVIVTNGCGEATEQFSMSGYLRTECPGQLEQRGSGSNLTVMYNKPIDCPILPIRDLEQLTSVPTIEVYDRMGRLVLRQQGEQVGLGHLRPGLYIVRAHNGGEVATLTVVRE